MLLVFGFSIMLLFYLVAITTLLVVTFKQGLQDKKIDLRIIKTEEKSIA